ncbi:hypothetical protein M3J09_010197 [Ascochyta lentis]
MNGHTTTTSRHTAGYADNETHLDVLVIGAGISGVNAAYRVQTELPTSSYAVLEGRHELGGTWSQFKYPGVRSDSDLHTLGFKFNPWKARNPIATGDSILAYLQDTVQKFDIAPRIRYNSRVASADWSSEQQRWQVQVDVGRSEEETKRVVYWTKWMILGTGYYSYEKAHVCSYSWVSRQLQGPDDPPTVLAGRSGLQGQKSCSYWQWGHGYHAASCASRGRCWPCYAAAEKSFVHHGTATAGQQLDTTTLAEAVAAVDGVEVEALPIHSRPNPALLLLHTLPQPRRLLHPGRGEEAASPRLPYRPAFQTRLQPLGTASMSMP